MLRFRDLGASFSRFGCFVLRSSFSKLPSPGPLIIGTFDKRAPGPVYEQVIPGCGIGATPFKYSIYTLSWGILGRFKHANEGGEMKKVCFLINNRETENRVLACKQNVLSRSLSIMCSCMYGS